MKILDFNEKFDQPIVIALGFFDSVHKGHIALIERAKATAKKLDATDCVFTFINDLSNVLQRKNGLVFTYCERLEKFEKLLVSSVIFTTFTKEFSLFSHDEFLDKLTSNFNVKAIVCGCDYRYGKGGLGNVETLKNYCINNSITCEILEEVLFEGEKISSSKVKNLLLNGEIGLANQLLKLPYFISGDVVSGRRVGRTMGFPTANIKVDSQKCPIKYGVYKTHVVIGGKKYNCITNYGGRPTFDLDEILTETYIDGFSGDLYSKRLTIYFEDYIRPIVKFSSVEELEKQLKKDLESIR